MKKIQHIQSWLLIIILALSVHGVSDAKLAPVSISISSVTHYGIDHNEQQKYHYNAAVNIQYCCSEYADKALLEKFQDGFAVAFTRYGNATKGVNNPVPDTLARVVPGNINPKALGRTDDVFVTDAKALKGLNSKQIAEKLTIPESSSGFKVIEFPSKSVSGIASPVNRTNPGFVGKGRTAGGAPEFVIPNGGLPKGSSTRVVK